MKNDLLKLLPENKHDTAKAAALVALGFPQVEPQIMEWLQDMNWPVARVLAPLVPLAPHIRTILRPATISGSTTPSRRSANPLNYWSPEAGTGAPVIWHLLRARFADLALEILRDLD
ncbi:DUF5071 domain-containing protein [Mesorhizobium sp. M1312]|uniref:DUF5071 domain-containing protein n=1 Tax=unclassified Mesorhizobium TaxID=325217 RepID=UPI00333E1818